MISMTVNSGSPEQGRRNHRLILASDYSLLIFRILELVRRTEPLRSDPDEWLPHAEYRDLQSTTVHVSILRASAIRQRHT